MEQQHPEPQPPALPAIRHDGWTGEKMATFCETLAETAVVAEACDAAHMGISGAYAARRRNPVFARRWDAALSIARERLADTLLARSMEGNVEQLYRDGELVGERHVLDNRLGLAILRRLDRLAETGLSLHSNPPASARAERGRSASPAILPRSKTVDWSLAVDALRTGDDEGAAKALALIEEPALSLWKGDEVEEVEDPLDHPPPRVPLTTTKIRPSICPIAAGATRSTTTSGSPTSRRPPASTATKAGPDDEQDSDQKYERECTEEEVAILEVDEKAVLAAERADDEAVARRLVRFASRGSRAMTTAKGLRQFLDPEQQRAWLDGEATRPMRANAPESLEQRFKYVARFEKLLRARKPKKSSTSSASTAKPACRCRAGPSAGIGRCLAWHRAPTSRSPGSMPAGWSCSRCMPDLATQRLAARARFILHLSDFTTDGSPEPDQLDTALLESCVERPEDVSHSSGGTAGHLRRQGPRRRLDPRLPRATRARSRAIRNFNLTHMNRGRNAYQASHCYSLADDMLEGA